MQFVIKDTIPFPRDRVYEVAREHLPALAEFLPNIRSIEAKERREEAGKVHFRNIWTAADTDVPSALRPFLKPELLMWTDIATWHLADCSCDWKSILGFLPDAISCHGHNTWVDKNGITEVTVTGQINVAGDKLGVPRLLARTLSETVEKFVIKTIEPNLRKTNEGTRKYLERHG